MSRFQQVPENWPMIHKSLGNIACEKHPIYAEDSCLDCEMDSEYEASLKESETAVSPKVLTSAESTMAEVLRERKIAKAKSLGDYVSKLIGFGWALTPDERVLQSYEEAGKNIEAMVL